MYIALVRAICIARKIPLLEVNIHATAAEQYRDERDDDYICGGQDRQATSTTSYFSYTYSIELAIKAFFVFYYLTTKKNWRQRFQRKMHRRCAYIYI